MPGLWYVELRSTLTQRAPLKPSMAQMPVWGLPLRMAQGFPNVAPVALWLPGQQPVQTEGGAGYLLPAGADMVIRIHYKKTWITEGQAFSDQTRVGFYFAKGTAAAIKTMLVESPSVLSRPRSIVHVHDR